MNAQRFFWLMVALSGFGIVVGVITGSIYRAVVCLVSGFFWYKVATAGPPEPRNKNSQN
jgi:hypothetical protein